MDATDPVLALIAERQHGLVRRDQALAIGVAASGWAHAARAGRWEPIGERVLRRRGAPRTPQQRALAAVLDAGPSALLSHGSAAAAWGHPAFVIDDPVEIVVVRHRSSRTQRSDLAVVHHPRYPLGPFAAVVDGVPTVRPSLNVLELAGRVHPERLRRIVDWYWSQRLLSGPSLAAELEPVLGRGRPGSAAVRELLASLPADYVPPASGLESRFHQIVRDHDLPLMRRQVDVGGEDRWTGRVDFLAVDAPLVVEVNSERYHTALTDRAHDARRRRQLERDGYVVVDVADRDVWHRPVATAAKVRSAWWDLRARRPAA